MADREGETIYEDDDTIIKKHKKSVSSSSSDSDAFAKLMAIGWKWVWFIGMLAGIDSILSQEGSPLQRFLIGGVMIAGVAVVIIYHLHNDESDSSSSESAKRKLE